MNLGVGSSFATRAARPNDFGGGKMWCLNLYLNLPNPTFLQALKIEQTLIWKF